MEINMKTYEQVVQQAVLVGAHAYFGGGNHYQGAHDFVDAAVFIYDVDRDRFMDDFEAGWDDAMQRLHLDHMSIDEVIEYIKEGC